MNDIVNNTEFPSHHHIGAPAVDVKDQNMEPISNEICMKSPRSVLSKQANYE